jgi:hypothetical protein
LANVDLHEAALYLFFRASDIEHVPADVDAFPDEFVFS